MIISPVKEPITEILSEQPTNALYEESQQYARLFKALSEPSRLCILHLLLRCGPLMVLRIEERLCEDYAITLQQPTVSHHLNILEVAGLVKSVRGGQRRCYYCTRPQLIEWFLADIEHADRECSDAQ
jgi:DNA-binding transcriptional ArsR family regulator